MDTPSSQSAYVVQAKRIMEVAEEENFPVFMPLNGVQWWTQLPEYWNHWDPDGNQTEGCKNNEYDKIDGYNGQEPIYRCKFPKLRDPEYRKRFIAGYNPENKWNVDWEDWETPMKLNWRNWGGGDMAVAPPNNLIEHGRTLHSFQQLQKQRFAAIVEAISDKITQWEKEGKQELFAGITIGTEVSLNASARKGPDQFEPYGLRAIQDVFCPKYDPTCGKDKKWTKQELHKMRQEVIFTYLNDMSQRAVRLGLPKQRIYTHVWSEAESSDKRYTNGIGASVTLYSRPGMSMYGITEDPLSFVDLQNALKESGYGSWAGPEFAPPKREAANWQKAFTATFDNPLSQASVVDIYNERDIWGTPAIPELQKFLSKETVEPTCNVSEIVPVTARKISNPSNLSWKIINSEDNATDMKLYISKGPFPTKLNEKIMKEIPLTADATEYTLPVDQAYGVYHWMIKRTGCNKNKWTISTPYTYLKVPETETIYMPWWASIMSEVLQLFKYE
jgi:hypothetical protein